MADPKMQAFFLLAAAGAAPAGAQTRGGFEAGLQVLDYNYRERLEGTTVVRDDGPMVGLTLGYVETIGNDWFLRARVDGASGEIDYRSDDGAKLDDVRQSVGHIELHVGRDFVSRKGITLGIFAGVGARALRDESGGRVASDGAAGYDREVGYAYVPIGASLSLPVGDRARLAVTGQYDHVFRGRARSKLSQTGAGLPDLTLAANRGHAFELAATMSLPTGRHAIAFGPFVRHWRIRQSRSIDLAVPEGVVTFFEPANRTTEAGLRVSFGF